MVRVLSCLLISGVLACGLDAQAGPGFRRIRVGSLEVTSLLDGELKLSPALLRDLDPGVAEGMLGGKEGIPTPVNAFLVRLGRHLVLVDTGGDAAMDPALGHIVARLKAAGVDPGAIEAVLITHFHGDHLGGLVGADGGRAFPHAVLRVAQAEDAHWMAPATEAALPADRKPMIARIKAALAPYRAAGAYKPFAPGEAPFAGVRAIPAPGHTPGHTVYAFDGGTASFWAVGDIAHFGAVQFQRPEATVLFDTDRAAAASARLGLWQRAAREGAVLGAAHLAAPGLGRVEVRGKAFAWVPEAPGK